MFLYLFLLLTFKDIFMRNEFGCVYFLKPVGMDFVKIGYSKEPNPNKRRVAISMYYPYGVEIVDFIQSYKPYELEKKIHKKLDAFKIKGEWYKVSKDQIETLVNLYTDAEELSIKNEAMSLIADRLAIKKGYVDLHDDEHEFDIIFVDYIKNNIDFKKRLRINYKELYSKFENTQDYSLREFNKELKLYLEKIGYEVKSIVSNGVRMYEIVKL